uniref:Cytokine like 1 n=1 Tax=Hucho hucho TaxID=62062 RepID=A0A4W5P4I0_9TELE
IRLGLVLCFFNFIWLADFAPRTCYSRKTCVEILPKMFLDVQNSCINTKLRDFLYVMENLPTQYCRERPRIVLLKRKVTNLYRIINRICYRVLYFTDDCEAIETGQSTPHYREDRLQLLKRLITSC